MTTRGGAKREVRVIEGGILSTVQDLGRTGIGWMGVSPAGAADWFSARVANRLVGNDDNAALIETTMTGISFTADCATRIAVTGAQGPLTIGGVARQLWRAHDVREGESVVVGAAKRGLRAYVAFARGIDVPSALGSSSTDVGSGFGGLHGRRLKSGDILHLVPLAEDDDLPRRPNPLLALDPSAIPEWNRPATLSVLEGPHALRVGVHAVKTLCERDYRVSPASSRQALRLEGEPLDIVGGTDVISEGICAGCVQVTSSGLPVLFLSEHQTTGGNAVALCVVAANQPHAAQLLPGDHVRFARTTLADAAGARDVIARRLSSIAPVAQIAPLGGGFFEGTQA